MIAWPLVNPKVGSKITIRIKNRKDFFMSAWFIPDLVQWPSKISEKLTTAGRAAVNIQIISVGRKSVSQAGKTFNPSKSLIVSTVSVAFRLVFICRNLKITFRWCITICGVVKKNAMMNIKILAMVFLANSQLRLNSK